MSAAEIEMRFLPRLTADVRGGTVVEYALIAALVALAAIGAAQTPDAGPDASARTQGAPHQAQAVSHGAH